LKKLLFLILLFLTALSLSAAPTSCGGIYYRNTAPDIINTKLLPKTTEICYEQFAIMHSGLTKTPLWSAEHLTRDMLTKKAKRGDDFHEDAHLRLDEGASRTHRLCTFRL